MLSPKRTNCSYRASYRYQRLYFNATHCLAGLTISNVLREMSVGSPSNLPKCLLVAWISRSAKSRCSETGFPSCAV
jgi:hypothetical protein